MAEEEVVRQEVQKSYSPEIFTEIQNAINSENAKIKILKNRSELPPKLYIGGVTMQFVKTSMYDVYLHIEESLNKDAMTLWKTEPAREFLFKDWKRQNKDVPIFDNSNYIEIKFKVKNANIVALLRRIDIDLAEDSFLLMEYGNVYYNLGQYVVIKAYVANLNENYSTKSILENNNKPTDKMYDNSGREIIFSTSGLAKKEEDDTEITMVPLSEASEMESEELF